MTNVDYIVPEDWRGEMFTEIRKLMKQVDSEIYEEVKYKKATNPNGVLVWYCNGMISTGEIYKEHLRLTLSKGVALKEYDFKGLINAHRAIIIRKEDRLDEDAFKDLMRVAVELNSKTKSVKVK